MTTPPEQTFQPGRALTSYVPPNQIIPTDWERAKEIMEERIIKDAHAINEREVAQYITDEEILTGQKWSKPDGSGGIDPNQFRQSFRKVIDLGGLVNFPAQPTPNVLEVAHNLNAYTSSTDFMITRIFGSATDGGTMYIPLPYVSAATGNIELCMDTDNVILTSTGNYSAYTEACVVIEYIRE